MNHNTAQIIDQLTVLINDQLEYLDHYVIPMDDKDLEWRPSKYKWNIYEVIEHLIRFGEFYLPKFRQIVRYPNSTTKGDSYKSGAFGRLVIKRSRPVNGVVVNKAKSPSKTNPFLRQLNRSVIDEYIEQQNNLIDILRSVEDINLSKNRIPTIIGSWIKLNFGDSLRLLIHHEERHFIQIDDLVNKRMDT